MIWLHCTVLVKRQSMYMRIWLMIADGLGWSRRLEFGQRVAKPYVAWYCTLVAPISSHLWNHGVWKCPQVAPRIRCQWSRDMFYWGHQSGQVLPTITKTLTTFEVFSSGSSQNKSKQVISTRQWHTKLVLQLDDHLLVGTDDSYDSHRCIMNLKFNLVENRTCHLSHFFLFGLLCCQHVQVRNSVGQHLSLSTQMSPGLGSGFKSTTQLVALVRWEGAVAVHRPFVWLPGFRSPKFKADFRL